MHFPPDECKAGWRELHVINRVTFCMTELCRSLDGAAAPKELNSSTHGAVERIQCKSLWSTCEGGGGEESSRERTLQDQGGSAFPCFVCCGCLLV